MKNNNFYTDFNSEKQAFPEVLKEWNDRFFCESQKLWNEKKGIHIETMQKPTEKLYYCKGERFIFLKDENYKQITERDAAQWLNYHGHELPPNLKKYEIIEKF